MLNEGKPPSYTGTLAAVTRLAYDRLRAEDKGAADVAAVCAFLAPEAVPVDWFTQAAADLPYPLASRVTDPLTRSRLLTRLTRSSLARLDPDGLTMHRLTQAILRTCLPPDQADAARSLAEKAIAASDPGDGALPGNWPAWARVLPHLLAVEPAALDSQGLRDLAKGAAWYLTSRGDAQAGHDLASRLYERARARLGPDDGYTLLTANALGQSLRDMGRFVRARQLDEDSLARHRRLSGEYHPLTLLSVTNLSIDRYALGEYKKARELIEAVLAHMVRVLGADHPTTLKAANNLAYSLNGLGEYRAARELHGDVLARCRRALGADHPNTMFSAMGLAYSLRKLGEYQAARELDEGALAGRSRLLGADHPDTLAAASSLASSLRALGEYRAARGVDEDTLARRRRILGEDHPHTRQSASNLAVDLRLLRETETGSD